MSNDLMSINDFNASIDSGFGSFSQDDTFPPAGMDSESDILFDFDLDSVPNLKVLDPGEYQLRIEKAEKRKSKSGNIMIVVVFTAVNEPDADVIVDYMIIPSKTEEERTRNAKRRRLKEIVLAFGIEDYNNLSTWAGHFGYALLSKQEDSFGVKNRVSRYLTTATDVVPF